MSDSTRPPSRIGRAERLLIAATKPYMLAAIWTITLASIVVMFAGYGGRYRELDFSHYYVSSLAMLEHIDPYSQDMGPLAARLGLNIGAVRHETSTPTFVALFELFALFTPRASYWLWTCVNLTALALALYLLLFTMSDLAPPTAWLLAALALTYPPVSEEFHYAQTQIVILLMIVLAARWLDERKDAGAGLILALAALLRAFPLLLAGYLVVRCRWRALVYMGLGLAAGAAATLLLVGTGPFMGFINRLGFLTGNLWIYRAANVALGSFIARLFMYSVGGLPSGAVQSVCKLAIFLASIALLAATAVVTMSRSGERDEDLRAFSLWVAATIMLSPTAWVHYLVLLLVLFAQLFSAAGEERASRRAVWMAIGSYALIVAAKLSLLAPEPSVLPRIRTVFEEFQFGSLAMSYVAAWWFVRDRTYGPASSAELRVA